MRCSSCNIEVHTNEKRCPICNNPIKGESKSTFNSKVKKRSDEFVIKIIGLLFIICTIITLFIEYKNNVLFVYSKYIISGLIFAFGIIYITSYNKDLFKIIYKYSFFILIYLLALFFITKVNIIYEILVPSIVIANLILSFMLSLIIKKKYIIKYLNITLIMILLSFIIYIPIHLFKFKILLNIAFLSGICMLLYLLFFYFYEVKEKTSRFLNI